MLYIDGLGYVEDPSSVIVPPTTKINPQATSTTSFEDILKEKTTGVTVGKTLDEIFAEASEKYGLPKNLLEAVGYCESSFDPNCTSSSGAMGIMQLMPGTAAELGVTDAYDVYQNIMGGAKYLKQLYDMYGGNQSLMLAAYNAGSGTVRKYGGIPPLAGVQRYIAKVLDAATNGVNVPGTVYDTRAEAGNGTNKTDNSSNADRINEIKNAVLSAINGNSNILNSSSLSSSVLSGLNSINALESSYYSSRANNTLSYEEYKLLMQYYENMLNIISSMGQSDDENDDSNDSLTDLYKLGVQQKLGLTDSTYTSTQTQAAITKAAQAYGAASGLLDS